MFEKSCATFRLRTTSFSKSPLLTTTHLTWRGALPTTLLLYATKTLVGASMANTAHIETSSRRCAAMPRNLSRKKQAEELGATALHSTLDNSGAGLRYWVGLSLNAGARGVLFILGDPQVGAFSRCSCRKCRPWANRASYTSMTKFSKTLSTTSHRLSLLGPLCQRSKHAPLTMYGFSLITFSRTLILSAALRKSHISRPRDLKSSTFPGARNTPVVPEIREKQLCNSGAHVSTLHNTN